MIDNRPSDSHFDKIARGILRFLDRPENADLKQAVKAIWDTPQFYRSKPTIDAVTAGMDAETWMESDPYSAGGEWERTFEIALRTVVHWLNEDVPR